MLVVKRLNICDMVIKLMVCVLLLFYNLCIAQQISSRNITVSENLPGSAWLQTHSAAGRVRVKSWKTLRDAHIVKQDLDYSCGAASLATLLNGYYGLAVTEAALLQAMDKGDGYASFDDMARALVQFGFKAQGFAASWAQLVKLRVPVVVYLKHRKNDHFSVLRGIDENTVWLADPSLGNRTYSKAQFLAMWQTREGEVERSDLRGKFLAVLPNAATGAQEVTGATGFFSKTPQRQSRAGVVQLSVRTF